MDKEDDMQQVIAFMVTLRQGVVAEEFEALFRGKAQEEEERFGPEKGWQVQLYRGGNAPAEYVWVTRFDEREFERVSRAGWPFVLLAIQSLARQVLGQFAADMRGFSAAAATPQELLDDWNSRFGRFIKMSFDAVDPSSPPGEEKSEVPAEHPTQPELAAITAALRDWRVERFVDRAGRSVLRLSPQEGDTIHQPFEMRLALQP